MKTMMRTSALALIIVFGAISAAAQGGNASTGILLLAHGGKQNWNDEVMKVAATVEKTAPVEVAFGMASKRNIQQAVDRLAARGVREIVAVPLFVSQHSTVITSTEYLLGKREKAPPELAAFAKMDHGHGSSSSHGSHQSSNPVDPLTPVKTMLPIRMASALGGHPFVAEILRSRAADISRLAENEVVVIVAHGPVSDQENERWLADMHRLAEVMRGKSKFKRIVYLTVRDDAPEPIRSRATAELRAVVTRAVDEKSKVLIVPLLLSYGGIEEGIKKRLEGLNYAMSNQALLPDERLARWVLLQLRENANSKK